MRIIFVVIFLIFSTFARANGSLVFESKVYDFGTIKEEDGKVSCTFNYKNNENEPVVIENISVSCGCTTPEYSKAPIMAGQTRDLKITYDPKGRPGEFSKEIYILSGNGKNRNTLTIKGKVIPKPRTREDDFPVELSSKVRLNNMNLMFMYVGKGNISSMTLEAMNFSNKPAEILLKSKSKYVKVPEVKTLKPNESAQLTVSYDVDSNAPWGKHNSEIEIFVNGKKQGFEITTSAVFVEDFSANKQKNAPKVNLSSHFLSFGSIKKGQSRKREVTLKNEGNKELVIRYIKLPKGVTTHLKTGESIAPKGQKKITFELTPTIDKGRVREEVVLIFNDPIRPMQELKIFASVINE